MNENSKDDVKDDIKNVLSYHDASKHHFHRFARGPGYLDWRTQPDPFLRYDGAALFELERFSLSEGPRYDVVFAEGALDPEPVNARSVSRLFYDSLAISAWKQAGGEKWALRVNPSSGNLHPTEGYLVCGPVEGLNEQPAVCHYAPREHALEKRAVFSLETWGKLTAGLPETTLLVGLTSIHWREAWKYGERAFRYCHLDVGHVVAALSIAASGLGWKVVLLDGPGTRQLAALLGVSGRGETEPEHPDCLLAVFPSGLEVGQPSIPDELTGDLEDLGWFGTPNVLSPGHIDWPAIAEAAKATVKPSTSGSYGTGLPAARPILPVREGVFLHKVVHQRRSAQIMDSTGEISPDDLYRMLVRTIPAAGVVPFNALPWDPAVHLVLFVHRVKGIERGLYILIRDPNEKKDLISSFRDEFEWKKPERCPEKLEFYRLALGDLGSVSKDISCHQDIAADSCFSLGMLVRFETSLKNHGAWFYPRLYWECGMIGQILYLEAEACGIRGTGIGCFFDDEFHSLLGLKDLRYQSFYHFTVGKPVHDTRVTTLPAYP